jgi:hypothetical protein
MNTPSVPSLDLADVAELFRGVVVRRTICCRSVLALASMSLLLSPDIASAQISQVNIQHNVPGTLKQATGTNYMHIPGALAFEHFNGAAVERRIVMSWDTNADYTPASSDHAISTDGGRTWGATQTSPDLGVRAFIKQRTTGALLCYNFGWTSQPTNHSFVFTYYSSTDGGANWATNSALVDFGAIVCNSTHFHRDILEENDGSLYAIGYAHFPGIDQSTSPGFWRVVMIKSTDGGANWTYLSTIASSSVRDYTEATFARCADGSWLCVMKAEGADNFLRYRRSTNQGATWDADGTALQLPGMTSAFGVDPSLSLMPNGVLVLSWGPPNADPSGSRDLHVAFSTDGNGTTWSLETTVFAGTRWRPGQHNFPEAGYDDVYESSGYSQIPSVGAHRFLHLSDTGHSWSYDNTIPSPNPYSIRGRYVDVVRANEINRIDLKSRLAAGTITISTDMTYTPATSQEARSSGAIDGSTDYWSGAFKNATSGFYTIDLQSNHTINKIGICLHYNTAESATIDYSTDGTSWAPIKTYTNATHRALDYTALTPISARYVRVSVSAAAAPVCLNEIELYTNRDTFENNAVGDPGDPHGIIPPGYVANGTSGTQYGFAVRDAGTGAAGFQSERSFQMWDGSSLWRAGIKKTTAAATSKTLEFRVKPLAYASSSGAIQFVLMSGATNTYQMAIFPDGSIKYYNGSTWVNTTGTGSPAGAGTVPLNTWSVIKVTATISPATAAITVNGVAKGNAGKIGAATTMDSFSFGSGGTGPSGDNALFDDILFQ